MSAAVASNLRLVPKFDQKEVMFVCMFECVAGSNWSNDERTLL